MFRNIVLATDGSDHATKAAGVAADIAAQYGATLTLMTVVRDSLSLAEVEAMPQAKNFSNEVKADIQHFRDSVKSTSGPGLSRTYNLVPAPYSAVLAVGDLVLDAAEGKAKNNGVNKIKRAVTSGHPAEAIVAVAKKENADLIVLGTRGLSDIKGIVVGSVSHQVMHLATCPCLTVK